MAAGPTRWARLEPVSRDPELVPGLEARIHDPLWLLARQWQFGEFTAGDGGSAILAQVSASLTPLTAVRNGRPGPAERWWRYSVPTMPLETIVEADDIRSAPTARMRVRAGQHFERLLAAHNVGQYADIVDAYRSTYPITPVPEPPDAASRRFLDLVAGRAIDGEKLYHDLLRVLPAALPPAPMIPDNDAAAVLAAAQAWLAWADSLAVSAEPVLPGWLPERLEYAFAAVDDDGIALEADEYSDGHLDWHTFTAAETSEQRAPPVGSTSLGPLTVVPTAVTYPGMPASRLWEFEDGRVNFGAVDAQPEDLGRMLLCGFALDYGANWLLIPLEVPVGTLVRITRLDVLDTFGHTTTVGPTAPDGQWRMFAISGADGRYDGALLIAPALAASLHGRDIEEVLLLRDETANLAWVVERAIEGEHGHPADLAQAAREAAPPTPAPSGPSDTLPYRLRTDPPPHWFPLLPQRTQPTDPSMTFRLGALPHVAPGAPPTPQRPRGRLLAPMVKNPLLQIPEEEVPREGARITRAYQLARWMDGSTYLWLARRKTIGRGEGSSGLRFDTTEPPA